jgi:quinol monooxygenase YgiN
MHILQIQHQVPNYDGWKAAFDADPVGRRESGVRRYRILRPIDNQNDVMIELDFDDAAHAEALLSAMQGVWANIQGTVVMTPTTRILEVAETKDY